MDPEKMTSVTVIQEDPHEKLAALASGSDSLRMFSVAQQLLSELLTEIFMFAVVEDRRAHDPRERGRLCNEDVPLRVSHVCRRWREAALSATSLWSLLDIRLEVLDCWEGRSNRSCLALFETYIQRSRGAPLTISSIVPSESSDKLNTSKSPRSKRMSFIDIVGVLAKYQERWQNVYIHYSGVCTYPTTRTLKLDELRLVEHLTLDFPFPTVPIKDEYKPVVDLSNCTHLQMLQLSGELKIVSNGYLLENLTEVDLTATDFLTRRSLAECVERSTFPTVQDVFQILRIAPNLRNFYARIFPSPDVRLASANNEDGSHTLSLPSLRRLVLQAVGREDHLDSLCSLLDRIIVPNIDTLGLWCRYKLAADARHNEDEVLNHADWRFRIPELLKRSSFPPIRALYIESNLISQREVRECLQMMPFLRDLSLVRVPYTTRGVLRLALDPQKAMLAPRLKLLRFVAVRFGGQQEQRIARVAEMVVSRWRVSVFTGEEEEEGDSRLKAVSFRGCDVDGLEEHPDIIQCKAEGLRVVCNDCF